MSRESTVRNQKGFTLIELMIVIAIIGILAAIAIPQFSNYRTRANNAAALSDAKNYATAQEVYYTDWSTYADTYDKLSGAGFRDLTSDVEISYGTINSSSFSATFSHKGGDKQYTVSSDANIDEADKS